MKKESFAQMMERWNESIRQSGSVLFDALTEVYCEWGTYTEQNTNYRIMRAQLVAMGEGSELGKFVCRCREIRAAMNALYAQMEKWTGDLEAEEFFRKGQRRYARKEGLMRRNAR